MANFMKRGSKWQARVTWRDGKANCIKKVSQALIQNSKLGSML